MRVQTCWLGSRFPWENENGNIEYKRKVIHSNEGRLQQLWTQMNYRLREGHGMCMYRVGVDDGGYCRGITEDELDESARNLLICARNVNPNMRFVMEKIPLRWEESSLPCSSDSDANGGGIGTSNHLNDRSSGSWAD